MTQAQQLFDLYKPTDLAVGRAQILHESTTDGLKVKYKYWTERRKASLDDFENHLSQHTGVGLAPIHGNSTCSWGAIDVDVYTGDLQDLVPRIMLMYPFVTVVRSKSGGMHIYVFLDDFYPAEHFVPELERIAAGLGYADSEIFPKQTVVQTDTGTPDCGNWLNLPYFGGSSSTTYALNKNGTAIDSIERFVADTELRRISLDSLRQHNPIDVDSGDFADGPPCLQAIWANGVDQNRNISLSNALVYLKKKYPDNWAEKVAEYNEKMANPLPQQEVDRTVQSYGNKDYRYQCKQQPLCRFCHVSECKKRTYGIGESVGFLQGNRSLTKICVDPPIWLLDLKVGDESKRISLTTEQLQNPRLFQRRCMEVLNSMPAIPKPQQWHSEVSELLGHTNEITVAHEDTPEGRLGELLGDYLGNRPSDEQPAQLLRDQPFYDGKDIHFRLPAFEKYLEFQRFRGFDHGKILSILKQTYGGRSYSRKIEGTSIRLWRVPASGVNTGPDKFNEIIVEEDSPF